MLYSPAQTTSVSFPASTRSTVYQRSARRLHKTGKRACQPKKGITVKIGIDSYCYHRFFGEVYGSLGEPQRRMSYPDFLRRAVELKVDGVSLETCFFESFDDAYLQSMKEIIDEGHLEPVIAWGHPKGFEGGKAPQAMAELRG